MIEAYTVRSAIRRAKQQYGDQNVRLSSQFARLLATNSVILKSHGEEALRNAFLGPIDCGAYCIDESNAMWFLPESKLTRTVFLGGLIALNRTRRKCEMRSVSFKPRPVTAQIGEKHRRAVVARSIARYFFSKQYMKEPTMPGKTTLAHIEAFLKKSDLPKSSNAKAKK